MVVKQLPHRPKVKGLIPVPATGKGRENMANKRHLNLPSDGSTVVKRLPHHPNVNGSSPAPAASSRREKMANKRNLKPGQQW
jgi:hypothetical protein